MNIQSAHRRALPGFFVALALALALALAGCGGAASHGASSQAGVSTITAHATATATAAATAIPAPPLPWRQVSLPSGINLSHVYVTPSHVNGRDAWACAQKSAGSYQILRTQDGGASWQVVNTLTPTAQLPVNSCGIVADAGDVNSVAVTFGWGTPNSVGPTGSVTDFSYDAGANWARLPGNLFLEQVATFGGATYAILYDTAPNGQQTLVASANHLATWHSIMPMAASVSVQGIFWAADGGQLIWSRLNSSTYYHSTNGGASWTKIPPPAGVTTQDYVEVTEANWNAQSGAWLLCGDRMQATDNPHTQNECTSNLGQTWLKRDNLTSTWECANCANGGGPSSGVAPCFPSLLTSNGALLAVCGNDPQDTGATPSYAISRLAPGSSSWAMVGAIPCQSPILSQTGQLMCTDSATTVYELDQLP